MLPLKLGFKEIDAFRLLTLSSLSQLLCCVNGRHGGRGPHGAASGDLKLAHSHRDDLRSASSPYPAPPAALTSSSLSVTPN